MKYTTKDRGKATPSERRLQESPLSHSLHHSVSLFVSIVHSCILFSSLQYALKVVSHICLLFKDKISLINVDWKEYVYYWFISDGVTFDLDEMVFSSEIFVWLKICLLNQLLHLLTRKSLGKLEHNGFMWIQNLMNRWGREHCRNSQSFE